MKCISRSGCEGTQVRAQMTVAELPGVLGSVELNPRRPDVTVPRSLGKSAENKQNKTQYISCNENHSVPSIKNRLFKILFSKFSFSAMKGTVEY